MTSPPKVNCQRRSSETMKYPSTVVTTKSDCPGRRIVCPSDNYGMCEIRLRSLHYKLTDQNLLREYHKIIHNQQRNGIIERVTKSNRETKLSEGHALLTPPRCYNNNNNNFIHPYTYTHLTHPYTVLCEKTAKQRRFTMCTMGQPTIQRRDDL